MRKRAAQSSTALRRRLRRPIVHGSFVAAPVRAWGHAKTCRSILHRLTAAATEVDSARKFCSRAREGVGLARWTEKTEGLPLECGTAFDPWKLPEPVDRRSTTTKYGQSVSTTNSPSLTSMFLARSRTSAHSGLRRRLALIFWLIIGTRERETCCFCASVIVGPNRSRVPN